VGRPRYLDEAGYRSTTSERIRSTSQKQSPDVIILDLMTPVMDGFEVLDALQRDERTADVPVLVVSAMKDARERHEGCPRAVQGAWRDRLPREAVRRG
jgi:two-component system, OmpR family, response regulator RpaA